jgi:hypothetical protein
MSDLLINIFNHDAFSVVSLTDAVADKKVRSGRLTEMGLFDVTSVTTLEVAIEQRGDWLEIVPPSPRGAPGTVRDMPKRTIQNFKIPHFGRSWSVIADEVQDVRKFGGDGLESVQSLVAERLATHIGDFDVTEEHARLGAVQGIITYKGGQTLNLFNAFGVAPPEEVDFDLDNPSPAEGVLRKRCTQMIRSVRSSLGGHNFDTLHAFVGDNFFDDLLMHREVRDTYKGWSDERILRESYVGKSRSSNPIFEFGGIVWENYSAIDDEGDGGLIGIDADEAKIFPLGLPRLFRTYYGPGDFTDTVNIMGKRLYAKQWPMQNGKGIHGEIQMNALHLCTRPGALRTARRT